MIDLSRYVGIPFCDGAAIPPSFRGADCFGLLRLFYAVELGIEVPDPRVSAGDVGGTFAAYQQRIAGEWMCVDVPAPWCAVAMAQSLNCPDIVQHFGVYVDGGRPKVLHSTRESGAIISDLTSLKWSIKGFFVWRG